jgi:hypothetical protein
MTLVACATCQQPISSHAAACPKCGSLAAASSLSAVQSAEVTAAPTIGSAAFAGRWLGWAIGSMSIIVLAVVLVAGLSRNVSMGFANAGVAVIVLGGIAVGVDFYLRRKVTGDMLPVRRSEIWGTAGLWAGIVLLAIPRATWTRMLASLLSVPGNRPDDPAGGLLSSWLIGIGLVVGITYCLRRLQWAAATRAMVEVGRRESYAEFVARTSPAAKRSP